MSLRQKIENHFRNRSGQGSLVGVIVATVMLSMICAAGTEWYLSMRKNIGNTEEKLEAQTIAMSEWERLSHMSLDELEASREALKKPYAAGQFTVSVNLGQKGTFNNGTCGAVTGGYANCFKDTTITVSRDGSRLFTTRTLPLMAGNYTRREIDNLLASMKNDYTNKYNTLANRLNGKEFVKNKTPNYDLNLRYEKKAGEDKFSLHAYNGNTEIPLALESTGTIIKFPDYKRMYQVSSISVGPTHSYRFGFSKDINTAINATSFVAPEDGYLYVMSSIDDGEWSLYIDGARFHHYADSEPWVEVGVFELYPITKGSVAQLKDVNSITDNMLVGMYFIPMVK